MRTTERSVVGAEIFARAHVFYLLTADEAGHSGAVEMRRLIDGSLIRIVHVCSSPRQLGAILKRGLLYVACQVGEDDDDPTTIVVVEAASGKITQITAHSTKVQLAVDESSDLPYQFVVGDHLIKIDVRTGRMLSTVSGCDSVLKVEGGRLYCRVENGHAIAVVDERSGRRLQRFAVGALRDPADLVVAPALQHAYVPFSAAGSIGVYDARTGVFQTSLPARDSPLAVFADDRSGRVLAVAAARDPTRTVLVVFDRSGPRVRELTLNRDWPREFIYGERQAKIERDPQSGRYIIGDANALTVVSSDGYRVLHSIRLPGSGQSRAFTFDETAGVAYAIWNGDDAGFFAKIDVRRTNWESTNYGGHANAQLRREQPQDIADSSFIEPQPPAFSAPTGLRSPWWLAAGPNATIAVSLYGEKVIGLMQNGKYTERRLNVHGDTAFVTFDRSRSIWFSEFTSGDSQYIGRVLASGTLEEFRLPAVAGVPSERAGRAGESPIALVNGVDGYIWGFDAGRGLVWRIDSSGKAVARVLPPHDLRGIAMTGEVSIVPRPTGGVYVALDRIWSVATDGTIAELLPPLGQGSLGALAPLSAGGFRFLTIDTIGTVSAEGGVVGLPITQWIIKVTRVRDADGRMTTTAGAICRPHALVVFPDDVNWFACSNTIMRIDQRGSARTITMSQSHTNPTALTVGGDGAIWFAEPLKSKIGRIDKNGRLTEFPL